MSSPTPFARLSALFADATCLPEMPTAALKVSRLLESENTSTVELERAIANDPALSAALLRAASSALFGGQDSHVTTVRGAIVRLGSKAVKSVAVSLWTQAIISGAKNKSTLDPKRFTDHSLFVGYMARYLFSCRKHREAFRTDWSPDEIFAAGVLHDLGPGLLAVVDGPTFDSIHRLAITSNCSFEQAFETFYKQPLKDLGVAAVKTWGLDVMFSQVIGHLQKPEEHPFESVAISCVTLADHIANEHSHAMLNLPTPPCSEFAVEQVSLPEEDVPDVVQIIGTMISESHSSKAA